MSQEYDSLPSRYEQKKILNFFITKYPIEVQRILDEIGGPEEPKGERSPTGDDSDDIPPLEDDGVEEAKTAVDDDSKAVAKGKVDFDNIRKPKSYHKKVIKYY